jgi:hypothetical protein
MKNPDSRKGAKTQSESSEGNFTKYLRPRSLVQT